ncbi:MAG: hypothetical protein M3374_01470 [Pseudomonadota bacterium]|nr:hypothetical protein [Pseudomonadota bacterium]
MSKQDNRNDAGRDMNRDPITGAPGSHPVGVGVGGAGGAAAGAAIGALFGPIGMLIGGGIGAVAGASAGKGVAERMDPTGEAEYWRDESANRPYVSKDYDYDNDYQPAYLYGTQARSQHAGRQWDDSLESDLHQGWEKAKGNSKLDWENAKDPVRDAWDRSDRTYRTYEATDKYHESNFGKADYRDPDAGYDEYKPAYRYGTQARSQYPGREWDGQLESDLERNWDKSKGESKLNWQQAKGAVKDAWHSVERAIPGDFDRDGR